MAGWSECFLRKLDDCLVFRPATLEIPGSQSTPFAGFGYFVGCGPPACLPACLGIHKQSCGVVGFLVDSELGAQDFQMAPVSCFRPTLVFGRIYFCELADLSRFFVERPERQVCVLLLVLSLSQAEKLSDLGSVRKKKLSILHII